MLAFVHHRAVWTVARWRFLSLQKLLTARIHTSWCMLGRAVPELTSIRYPNVQRGNFCSVTTADVEFFKTFLNSPGQVLTENDDLISYNVDWMGSYRGNFFYVTDSCRYGNLLEYSLNIDSGI